MSDVAVNVTVSPSHIVVLSAESVTAGFSFIVIVTGSDSVMQSPAVALTVAVYVPAVRSAAVA